MSDAKPSFSFLGRKKLALFVALMITSLLATGFVWTFKKVTVTADGKSSIIHTYHSNINNILSDAGVQLGAVDEVRLSTAKVTDGTVIEVFRAVPIRVTYQGKTTELQSGKPTVGEVVQSLGIPSTGISVTPDPQSRPAAGMEIRVVMISEQTVSRQVADPHPIMRQGDSSLEKGTEEVVQQGQDGIKEITEVIHYSDGVAVRTDVVAEKVVTAAVPQIIRTGTRETVQTSRGALPFRRVTYMEATAYHPNDGSGDGITATGIPARYGIVAVDPDVIPLGTRVFIPGYGVALAADTGGAIIGNKIDLCMEDYSEAFAFGRRNVKVYILD